MKQDEIIEMAKQAGGIPFRDSEIMGWGCEFDIEPLEAFAKLVAAKEREACAVAGFHACLSRNDAVRVRKAIRARGEA